MAANSGIHALVIGALLTAALALATDPPSEISRAAAEKAALAKVPGGKIVDGELEIEQGRRIWSFDIVESSSTQIYEVHVDAAAGKVLSVKTESPVDEEAEIKKERAELANPPPEKPKPQPPKKTPPSTASPNLAPRGSFTHVRYASTRRVCPTPISDDLDALT